MPSSIDTSRLRIIEVTRRGQRGRDGFTGVLRADARTTDLAATIDEKGLAVIAEAPITITLDDAATLGNGWHMYLIGEGGGITVTPSGSDTVSGAASGLVSDGDYAILVCDGAKFFLTSPVPVSPAATVPSGAIMMWSGSIASIPSGWLLCDGTNGTPDLRDRFIVGAGDGYAVGDTGGADSVTLTEAQMPAHAHTGATTSGGAHQHLEGSLHYTNLSGHAPYGKVSASGLANNYFPYDVVSRAYTSSAGSHSHSLTTNATGGDAAHENRPPYLALAYIMKA